MSVHIKFLRVLDAFQVRGVPVVLGPDAPTPKQMSFSLVPEVIVQALLRQQPTEIAALARPLIRKRMVSARQYLKWPIITPVAVVGGIGKAGFRVERREESVDAWVARVPADFREQLVYAKLTPNAPALGISLEFLYFQPINGKPVLTFRRSIWSETGLLPGYSISERGLAHLWTLDSTPVATSLGFVSAQVVTHASTREYVDRLLTAIDTLQHDGAEVQLPSEGNQLSGRQSFQTGVPSYLLRAWLGMTPGTLSGVISFAKQRGYLQESIGPLLPALVPFHEVPSQGQVRFVRPDERLAVIRWVVKSANSRTIIASAGQYDEQGVLRLDGFAPSFPNNENDRFFRLTSDGTKYLDRGGKRGVRSRVKLTDIEQKVAALLANKPKATVRTVAKAVGCATGTVAKTASWIEHQRCRAASPGRKSKPRTIQLDERYMQPVDGTATNESGASDLYTQIDTLRSQHPEWDERRIAAEIECDVSEITNRDKVLRSLIKEQVRDQHQSTRKRRSSRSSE